MSVKCRHCQVDNDDNAQFCSQCGAKLGARMDSTITFSLSAETGDETRVDIEQLRAEGPLLLVTKGIGVGQVFQLGEGQVLIGRDPDSDIFLDDVTVSRKHAILKVADGTYELEDSGSLNGTYVNRVRVDAVTVSDGDELQIGKFKMVFIDRHEAEYGK